VADSLRTFAQLIANVPDNTSGLVSPQDIREAIISGLSDGGSVADDADWTLTLASDTWTDIPSNSTGPALAAALLWIKDGSDRLVPDWANQYTVAAALERGAEVIARVRATKTGAAQPYQFRVVRDGSVVGAAVDATISSTTTASVSFSVADSYVVADEEPWSLEAQAVGHGDDLDVEGWSLAIRGVLL